MVTREIQPGEAMIALQTLALKLELKMTELARTYQLKEYLYAFFVTDELGQQSHSFVSVRQRYECQFADALDEVNRVLARSSPERNLSNLQFGQIVACQNNSLERRIGENDYFIYVCIGKEDDEQKLTGLLDELYEELLETLEPTAANNRDSLVAAAFRLLVR
ncbi:MAG: hypothetical protein Q4G02_00510 [bacterium]|nr:hypothetical protein [bacterium]